MTNQTATAERLKEAIERLQRYASGVPITEVWEYCDGYSCDEQRTDDRRTVADAYLATLVGAEEPITEEWLRSVGWYEEDSAWTHQRATFWLSRKFRDPAIWIVFVEVYELGEIRTRGDLTKLLAALGIPLATEGE